MSWLNVSYGLLNFYEYMYWISKDNVWLPCGLWCIAPSITKGSYGKSRSKGVKVKGVHCKENEGTTMPYYF